MRRRAAWRGACSLHIPGRPQEEQRVDAEDADIKVGLRALRQVRLIEVSFGSILMRTGGRQTFASPPPQLDRRRRHRPNPSSKSGGFGHDAATASAARACRRVAAPCARGPPRAAPEHDSPPPPLPPLAQRGVHRDPRPIHRDFPRDRVGIATLEHGLAFGGVLGVHGGLVVPGLRRSSPVVLFYAQSPHIPRMGSRRRKPCCSSWKNALAREKKKRRD